MMFHFVGGETCLSKITFTGRPDVLGKGHFITEQCCHFFQSLALGFSVHKLVLFRRRWRRVINIRVEYEETKCRHCVAGYEDGIILPPDCRKSLGRKLVEEEANSGSHERANYGSVRSGSEFHERNRLALTGCGSRPKGGRKDFCDVQKLNRVEPATG